MNQMNKIFLSLLLLTASLFAEEGALSVLVFKEGTPVAGAEVSVDGAPGIPTDADGEAYLNLPAGNHEVTVVVKNAGRPLGVARKSISVVAEKHTQVIVSLNGSAAAIDVEAPEGAQTAAETAVESAAVKTGILTAQVVSAEDGKPVANARVFVKGSAVDAVTDEGGNLTLELPEGERTLSVIHTAFSTQTLTVTIVADETLNKRYELTPASVEMEEFVVLAPHIQGSIAAVMNEEKQSSAITSILGAEEMSKKGDSNAASALKRVTGVTLIDGKDVYVRGLGDRYSNVELNSMPLPSPDPTKRMIPLDIFPASVIGSIAVQKSASADIPSSYGGGYINVRTKEQSDENFLKVEIGLKGNDNTFEESNSYEGSTTDWYGYDNGYRDINRALMEAAEIHVGERPKSFTTSYFTKEEIARFTQDYISRYYNVTQEKLPLGFKAAVSGSRNFDIDARNSISVSGGYEYKQEHAHRVEESYAYDIGADGTLNTTPSKSGLKYKTTSTFEHGAIFNLGYKHADDFQLKYTALYTRSAEKSTRIADGNFGSNEVDELRFYYLDWEERELLTNQINGKTDYTLLGWNATFSFGAQAAQASLEQPNNYQYIYIKDPASGDYIVNNETTNHISRNLTSEDDLKSFYLKNRQQLPLLSEADYVEVGVSMSSKERESRHRKFYLKDYADGMQLSQDIDSVYAQYVLPDIPYDDRIFLVQSLFKAADYFDAEVDETALYLNTFVNPMERFEVMLGARYVDFEQTVYQYQTDRTNPDYSLRNLIARVPESLTLQNIYPSFSVKYKADENNHVDLAASQTYIVPDLREFTSGEYFHPYDVATVVGNPDLQSTEIFNVDLKYSHYFSATEAIKTGIFYKSLDKPIEDTQMQSSSLPIYSFDNAESAELYGLEIDGRKNLDIIDERLQEFYLSGNFSYTKSEVTLRPEQLETFTSDSRPLQGLSEVVLNTTLGYDGAARSLALSYNYMGERIRKVGLIDGEDRYPDQYEIPPQLLDFVWIEKFRNNLTAKVKLQNLLDSETVWKQGGRVTNRYQTGKKYEVSLSYKY